MWLDRPTELCDPAASRAQHSRPSPSRPPAFRRTQLIGAGVDVRTVAGRLGHTDATTAPGLRAADRGTGPGCRRHPRRVGRRVGKGQRRSRSSERPMSCGCGGLKCMPVGRPTFGRSRTHRGSPPSVTPGRGIPSTSLTASPSSGTVMTASERLVRDALECCLPCGGAVTRHGLHSSFCSCWTARGLASPNAGKHPRRPGQHWQIGSTTRSSS